MKKTDKLILLAVVTLFLLVLFLVRFGSSYYADYLWHQSQEQTILWWRLILYRSLFFVMGLSMATLCYLGSFLVTTTRLYKRQFLITQKIFWFQVAAALFIGLIINAGSLVSLWQDYMLAFYAPNYGLVDPIFQLDASFYMFRRAFYQSIISWMQVTVFITFLLTLVAYLTPSFLLSFNQRPRATVELIRLATPHLAAIAGLFVLLMAFSSYLSRFDMIIEGSSDKVAGASYVDVYARNYGRLIFAYLGILFAIVLPISGFFKRWRPPLYIMGTWIVAYIALVQIYPGVINLLQVNPNQFNAEKKFIEYSIAYTREGYQLSEVNRRKLPVQGKLDSSLLNRNRLIIDNIRLWDYRPIRATFRQLQEIRQYYQFLDVDVDRYQVDGGMRQVMVAAREMNKGNLPQRTRTWESRHLQYTHGYGIAMAPSNQTTAEGLPELWIRDFPPQTLQKDLPQVKQAAIYYGEITNDYVVVNTSLKEIDYPLEDGFAETNYSGKGGILLGSGLRRLALAWEFDLWKLLISKYIDSKSKILFNRNIHAAVRKLAPFLHFDLDPYIVLSKDGNLYWIMDAYTTSQNFPYSARFERDTLAAIGTLGKQQYLRSLAGINYIRNSVKVVINAHSGKINFYLFDEEDPIIHAWQNFLPQLIKPLSEMPSDLLSHIRYPESLFMVQAAIYTDYHMDNPQAFYNLEDRWQVASEVYSGNQQQMEPYYTVIKLPGSQREEYILMLPFIPNNKDNMIAWMAARCDYSVDADGKKDSPYGELLLFEFPRTRQIYGPIQIESRIDQDPEISKDLTLWNQQGSRVIRGNLLVIPIEETILYVEPIYLQSTNSPFPELRRVVVADSSSVVMGENLQGALRKLVERASPSLAESSSSAFPQQFQQQSSPPSPSSLPSSSSSSAREAQAALQQAEAAAARGNWSEFGRQIDRLKAILNQLQQQGKQ